MLYDCICTQHDNRRLGALLNSTTFCYLFCLKIFKNIDIYINNNDMVSVGIRKHIP